MSVLLLIYLVLIHSICYLLLHDKLPQNMASKNIYIYFFYIIIFVGWKFCCCLAGSWDSLCHIKLPSRCRLGLQPLKDKWSKDLLISLVQSQVLAGCWLEILCFPPRGYLSPLGSANLAAGSSTASKTREREREARHKSLSNFFQELKTHHSAFCSFKDNHWTNPHSRG